MHNTCETLGMQSLKHVALWYLFSLPKLSKKNQCQLHLCAQGGKTCEIIFLTNKWRFGRKFLPRNSEGPFLIQMAYFGKFGSIEMSVASWSSPRLSALELTLSSTVGWGVFSLLQSSSFGEYSSPSLSSSSSSSFSYTF